MKTVLALTTLILIGVISPAFAHPQLQFKQSNTEGRSLAEISGKIVNAEFTGEPTIEFETFDQRPSVYDGFSDGAAARYTPRKNLNVDCSPREVSPGKYKFNCEGVNKEEITLRSEHILWLQSNGGRQQVLDIEVPNYKIDELIKAGFKTTAVGGTRINVLLKKPEQVYDAEVDIPSSVAGNPSVNLQYEPVSKQVVHFPNDKPYRTLSGPILPPLEYGRRPQRGVIFQHQGNNWQ